MLTRDPYTRMKVALEQEKRDHRCPDCHGCGWLKIHVGELVRLCWACDGSGRRAS